KKLCRPHLIATGSPALHSPALRSADVLAADSNALSGRLCSLGSVGSGSAFLRGLAVAAISEHSSLDSGLGVCDWKSCFLPSFRLSPAGARFYSPPVALHPRVQCPEERGKLPRRLLACPGSIQVSVDGADRRAARGVEDETSSRGLRNSFDGPCARFGRVGGLAERTSLSRVCSANSTDAELRGCCFRTYAEPAWIVTGMAFTFFKGDRQ